MYQSNRTIEEKLAIVQQLKGTSATQNTKTGGNLQKSEPEEKSFYLPILLVRVVICLLIFGILVFSGKQNPDVIHYVQAMITSEENGNLIDFMSPFTYTLQKNM